MPEMKDSGIEWIGDISKKCSVVRLKHDSYMKGRIGWQGLKSNDFIDKGPYCITSTDFENDKVVWERCYHVSEDRYEMDPYIQVKEGDILISKDGTIGKLAIIDTLPDKACLNSHLLIIRPSKQYTTKYLYYILSSIIFVHYYSLVGSGSTMQSLSQEKLGEFSFPIWSIDEQQIITAFLDTKCSEIDALSADIQKEIDILEEYKKSVITEAVTKGLDPNVEMKDSGNKWYSDIPFGWKVLKVLYVLEMPITDGPHTTPMLYSDGVPFVSAEAVSCGNGSIDFDHIRGYISEEFYQQCCRKYIPQKNDIYMIKSGATTGRVSIVDTDKKFTIWSPLAVFRCDKSKANAKYMYYMLQANPFQSQVQDAWSFGTQQNIGMRALEKLKVCLPPLSEQNAIADYLDKCCHEIDMLLETKNKQLNIVEEYKKSLIYEYVTGKKEVPDTYE